MLSLKFIIKNLDLVKKKLKTRNFDLNIIDEIYNLGQQRLKILYDLENLENQSNKLSKKIGILKSQKQDVQEILIKLAAIKKEKEILQNQKQDISAKINPLLLSVPNLPSDKTPFGQDETSNVIIKEHTHLGKGKITKVVPHYEIGLKLNIIDFVRSVNMSGTRFWMYQGQGAMLLRALKSFMIDTHIQKQYFEIIPPLLVNSKTMTNTGQLPKFANDLFKINNDDKWLIPTAEVPLTNYYQNQIIDLTKPKSFVAFTPCFRAESGSGGKDMKGLIRAHQFYKVELVKIVNNKMLAEEYQKTIADAKNILELLELPYQELQLCTGDLGFAAQETVDLEVWLPSEKRYREISSISSFGTFQCQRASIRYYDNNKKVHIANSINGSGLALDRTIAAILEHYQNDDGSISIPKVLWKYTNGQKIIK